MESIVIYFVRCRANGGVLGAYLDRAEAEGHCAAEVGSFAVDEFGNRLFATRPVVETRRVRLGRLIRVTSAATCKGRELRRKRRYERERAAVRAELQAMREEAAARRQAQGEAAAP